VQKYSAPGVYLRYEMAHVFGKDIVPAKTIGGTHPPPSPTPHFLISGTIYEHGTGKQSANVAFGGDGTATTDVNGAYNVSVLSGYSGVATPSASGGTFDPSDRVYSNLAADSPNQNYNFYASVAPQPPQNFTISGTVTQNSSPIPNAVVVFTGSGSITANSNGVYSLTVENGYAGTALPVKSGGTFNPLVRIYTDVEGNLPNQNFAFYVNLFTISGTITENGSPLADAVVVFSGSGTIAPDVNGVYSLTVAQGYAGTALPIYSGGTFDPLVRVYTDVESNQLNQNFAFYGTVTPLDCPLPGVPYALALPLGATAGNNAIDPVSNVLFTHDYNLPLVYLYDTLGGTYAGSIDTTPQGPFGFQNILYDVTNQQLALLSNDNSVVFIDPATKAVTATVAGLFHPESIAMDNAGTFYTISGASHGQNPVVSIISGASHALLSTATGTFSSSPALAWCSNINQLAILTNNIGGPRFVLFNPATSTFAASVLTNPTTFTYEMFYIAQHGHLAMSYDGGRPSQIVDISLGTAAVEVATLSATRFPNCAVDTCNNRLFASNGFNTIYEYFMSDYVEVFEFFAAGVGLAHSRATNMLYYEDFNAVTFNAFHATLTGTNIGDLNWVYTNSDSPPVAVSSMFMQGGDGNLYGFAQADETAGQQTFSSDEFPGVDGYSTGFANLGGDYPVTFTVVYDGSLSDSGTIDIPSFFQLSFGVNNDFVSTDSTMATSGTLTVNGTVKRGFNTMDLSLFGYNGANFENDPSSYQVRVTGTVAVRPLIP
jgi:YVTN family beta-propeller protein